MPTTSRDTSRRRVRLATILFIVAGLAGATAHVASAATKPIGDATATVETDPVAPAGDAADDPAIWVHPTNPSRSVVIGNDKGGAFVVGVRSIRPASCPPPRSTLCAARPHAMRL